MQKSLQSYLKETTRTPLYEEFEETLTLPEISNELPDSKYSRTSPCETETTPVTPTSTSRRRRFESFLEVDYPAPKKVKVKKSEQLIDFLQEQNIYCLEQWRAVPFEEKKPYLTIPHLHGLLSTTFAALLEHALLKPLTLSWRQPLNMKIQNLLQYQGWKESRMHAFLSILLKIVNRQNGKKNCLWLWGESNAGKTQLMKAFVDTVCPGMYGIPLSNVRSAFMFGNCVNKRLIFWEEPMINAENIEAVKNMFAGGSFSVDVKYRDNIIVDPTPVIVTSNHHPTWNLVPDCAKTIMNRVEVFKMDQNSDDFHEFPITGEDWFDFHGCMKLYERFR